MANNLGALFAQCLCFLFLLSTTAVAQNANDDVQGIFDSSDLLALKFAYSNKQVKRDTDKKNGIKTELVYPNGNTHDTLGIVLRARGNFRRANCYFPPLKMYLKKEQTKNTIFTGHKRLKVVLPCLLQNRSNDDVLKEFLAYKMYGVLTPAHFRTRLVDVEYSDTRGVTSEIHPLAYFKPERNSNSIFEYNDEEAYTYRKPKTYRLKAILIEDDKKVAKRNNAKVLDRFVHPLAQDDTAATRNAFFQFMIGNTDFSTAHRHNQKLLFKEGQTVPLPYDFDMSGLVNASYAVVSNINGQNLPKTDVTQRLYRGFKRNAVVTQQIRTEYLNHKDALLQVVDEFRDLFADQKTYRSTRKYLLAFFDILESDKKFKAHILDKGRTQ